MHRLWLIARREIVAYTGVASFWIALVLGPVLMLATALISATMAPHAPAPATVRVSAAEADLQVAAARALKAAGLRAVPAAAAGPKDSVLVRIALEAPDHARVRIEGGALPAAATPLLNLELRQALQRRLLQDPATPAALRARAETIDIAVERAARAASARPAISADRIGRFGVTMLLWLTLVGALGMLLQAIVRERSQRALESLMSAARPVEIVGGKLLGVGLVSLIVLAAWLGTGAAAAPLAGGTGGRLAPVLLSAAFGDPARLAYVLVVYVMAFAMYGSALLGIGAFARDVASAQNLSRPVFGVLLLVFFAALSQLGGSGGLSPVLLWAPPVTPFALLLAAPGSLSVGQILGGLAVMLVATGLGLGGAAHLLVAQLDGAPARRLRGALQPATA